MSKSSGGVNGRGEDWQKYLRALEDPQIKGILNDDPAMRLNRQQRRAAQRPDNIERAIRDERDDAARREQTEKFRAIKMGEWWRDAFEQLVPKWIFNRFLNGDRRIPLIMGFQWGSESGNEMVPDEAHPLGHRLVPFSRAWITRKRFWFLGFGKPVLQKIKAKEKGVDGVETGSTIEVESWFKFIWG